jgi:glycerate 2-kinase
MTPSKQTNLLKAMFASAVDAALPAKAIAGFMPRPPKGRTIVIGAGKASAAMAQAFEHLWQGPLEGLVVTRAGHAVPCAAIEILEASHPVPDARGVMAAERMLKKLQGLTPDDLVVALMSGGGSSLLSLPVENISAEDKRAVNKALLASGAPIGEMNIVRRHLSRIKGGRLAIAAYPARVVTLAISDVPGDDLAAVASGPTVPDLSTFEDARAVIAKYNIAVPLSVTRHLAEARDETPKPGDPRFDRNSAHCIASPQQSLMAAAAVARSHGYTPIILGDALEGEARDVGIVLAGIALQTHRFGQPVKPPCAIISGGETTVTVRGQGTGGRNVECLLSMALKLNGASNIHAIAADTDGIDGGADVAGAIITPTTLQRARMAGLDPSVMLINNDAHSFFAKIDDQLITGPTLTNVNDFRCILVG